MIRSELHWRKRAKLYWELYRNSPLRYIVVKYDEEGIPIKPREFALKDWERLIRNCDKVIGKYGLTYQEIIDNRMIRMPRIKYKIKNRVASRISKEMILGTIEKIISKGHIPMTTTIGNELGICVWTLRELCDRYRIELPHRERWKVRPNNKKQGYYKTPPGVNAFGKS